MSSNISVDDLLNSMKNSNSTPVVPLDNGGVSVDSLLQNMGKSNKSPEVANAGVGEDLLNLQGKGF